jgi:hypothetical protein
MAALRFDLPADRGQGRPWIPSDLDDLGGGAGQAGVTAGTTDTGGIEGGMTAARVRAGPMLTAWLPGSHSHHRGRRPWQRSPMPNGESSRSSMSR